MSTNASTTKVVKSEKRIKHHPPSQRPAFIPGQNYSQYLVQTAFYHRCVFQGGVVDSYQPRFFFHPDTGKVGGVWINSCIKVDWCVCQVKSILAFRDALHEAMRKAGYSEALMGMPLVDLLDHVLSLTGPLGEKTEWTISPRNGSPIPTSEEVAEFFGHWKWSEPFATPSGWE